MEPTHVTVNRDGGNFVERHPSQIEREKLESAYYLRVVWPLICGAEPASPLPAGEALLTDCNRSLRSHTGDGPPP